MYSGDIPSGILTDSSFSFLYLSNGYRSSSHFVSFGLEHKLRPVPSAGANSSNLVTKAPQIILLSNIFLAFVGRHNQLLKSASGLHIYRVKFPSF